MASIPDFFKLRENSMQTTTEFANKLTKLKDELQTHITTLSSHEGTNASDISLADIEAHWAHADSNPLGPLAEMGMPGANAKINPKVAIYEQINEIKQLINRKTEQDSDTARQIQGRWEEIVIDEGLANKPLKDFPSILESFAENLKNLDVI
jgi:hypothetical protein